MNTPYSKKVADEFQKEQNYLKTNGFSRSPKHVLKDIENNIRR